MEAIKVILEKCQSLWEDLVTFKTSLDKLQTNLNAQKEAQDELQKKLEEWQSDLAEREVETGKIESVVKLNEENKDLAVKISQEREKLAQETQAFNEYVTKENYSLSEKRTLLTQDEETLKKGEEKLKADTKQLEKDRQELKKKILEKIDKEIK